MSNEELLREIRKIVREEIARSCLEERYIDINRACKYMKVTRSKIYKLMSDGFLPWSTFHDGRRRIDKRMIDLLFYRNIYDPEKKVTNSTLRILGIK